MRHPPEGPPAWPAPPDDGPAGVASFPTALGVVGIAWSARGIAGVQLPERTAAATASRLRRRFPDAAERPPDPHVATIAARIAALLRGAPDHLRDVPLDLAGVTAFDRAVYALARAIPAGDTRTYGALAAALGDAGRARAVGQALGRNPVPIIVPCHRITAAGGKLGGFSGAGGRVAKVRLLALERGRARAGRGLPLFG